MINNQPLKTIINYQILNYLKIDHLLIIDYLKIENLL